MTRGVRGFIWPVQERPRGHRRLGRGDGVGSLVAGEARCHGGSRRVECGRRATPRGDGLVVGAERATHGRASEQDWRWKARGSRRTRLPDAGQPHSNRELNVWRSPGRSGFLGPICSIRSLTSMVQSRPYRAAYRLGRGLGCSAEGYPDVDLGCVGDGPVLEEPHGKAEHHGRADVEDGDDDDRLRGAQ